MIFKPLLDQSERGMFIVDQSERGMSSSINQKVEWSPSTNRKEKCSPSASMMISIDHNVVIITCCSQMIIDDVVHL